MEVLETVVFTERTAMKRQGFQSLCFAMENASVSIAS
jgi:hypothetical protein